MKSDNFWYLIRGISIGLILGVLLHYIIPNCYKSRKLKEEAIKLNYAEHNKSTGEWQWVGKK
jgi:hypothetical protein